MVVESAVPVAHKMSNIGGTDLDVRAKSSLTDKLVADRRIDQRCYPFL